MPPPLPTPYDITDVPHVPWSPTATEWLYCGFALATLALIVWLTGRRRSAQARARVLDLLLEEIEHSAAGGSSLHMDRLAHLSRRVVEYVSGRELSSLSPNELERASAESSSEVLTRILHELAELESSVYEPPSSDHDDRLRKSAQRLAQDLRDFVKDSRIR